MLDLQTLIDRFRRASRDTYNTHFQPYEGTDGGGAAFGIVEHALFQVIVMDPLGDVAPGAGQPISRIGVRPRHAQVDAWLQPENRQGVAAEDGRFDFIALMDFEEPGAPKTLDWVRARIGHAEDPEFSGKDVILRFVDVVFERG